MKRINQLFSLAFIAMTLGIFVACSNDDDSSPSTQGTARMSVQLVDAPGDYESVFIDVQDVVIKYNGEEDEVSIGEINTGVYDLLTLTGGVSVLLVDDEIPAGTVSQIRLVLGENNSIVVEGETFPLSTPSAQQSGLKIQLNETLEENIFYEFILDFDVEESIVTQGNGGYSLKPVVRASAVAETGAISGSVLPLGSQFEVSATNGVDTITTYTNAEGQFVLNGVSEGSYQVTITPDPILNIDPIVLTDISVEIGATTDLGLIQF